MASSIRYLDSSSPLKRYPIFSLFDKLESKKRVEETESRKREQSEVTQKGAPKHMHTAEERAQEKKMLMEKASNDVSESLRLWQEGAVKQETLPTTLKGVAVSGLRKMSERVRSLCGEGFFAEDRVFTDGTVIYGTRDYEALTTTQVVYQFVRDEEVSGSLRLADCAAIIDPSDLGRPSYFISHAWKGTFAHLLDQIFKYCKQNNIDESERFWLDVLAVNQHGGRDCSPLSQAQNQADVRSFQNVLSICDRGTVVVLQLDKVNTANRAWCLYEWSWTLYYHGNKGLKFLGIESLNEAKKMLNSIYVELAECYDPRDKEMILADVRAHHGTLPLFDDMLKEKLRAIFINQFHQLPPKQEAQAEETDEPTAAVLYDNGDFDANIPVSCLVYRKLGDAVDKLGCEINKDPLGCEIKKDRIGYSLGCEIKKGDTVWCPESRSNYQSPQSLYPGKVLAIRDKTAGAQNGSKEEVNRKDEDLLLFIKFDDGDSDEVPLSQVFPGPGNPLFGDTDYDPQQLKALGSIVYATYKGGHRLYQGKVEEKPRPVEAAVADEEVREPESSEPETYVIVAYDDGDFDPRVAESTIKEPSEEMLQDGNNDNVIGRRVQAPWKGGSKLWPGRVINAIEAAAFIEEKIKSLAATKIAKIEEQARVQVESVKCQVETVCGLRGPQQLVYVKFEDGDEDDKVPLSRVVPKDKGVPWPPSDPSSLIGTSVMAPYKNGAQMYPGVIAPHSQLVYVEFDDGDTDRDVVLTRCLHIGPPDLPGDPVDNDTPAEQLLGTRVMAPYKGSRKLFPGTIAQRVEESAVEQSEREHEKLTGMFALAKSLGQ